MAADIRIAAVGVILMSVAVMIGGATVARWGMQRLRRGKPAPGQEPGDV